MNTLLKKPKVSAASQAAAPKSPRTAPIRVAFLLFDGFQPIDLAGPWQAFSTANEELGWARYHLLTVSGDAISTTTGQGLRVQADQTLAQASDEPLSMVVVPGGEGVYRALRDPQTLEWLRQQDARTERTCSVCTGAFLLAAAGLLKRRTVTTHWRAAERLRREFPDMTVHDDRIYCESGKYWTAAGVSAGIDLALALIERDCSADVAQRVARRLVVYLRRNGDQRQYSQTLRVQDRAHAPFRQLLEKIEASLGAPWSVDEMADASGMSRRSFQRKFSEHFGMTPMEVLRTLRQERARVLEAAGNLSRKEIARQVGRLNDATRPRNSM
jgi:transcriptional regulator GlxA family with amidase domain